MLLEKYPKLEIQLQHDISRKINEQIIKLNIDVGVVVNPYLHPDLVVRELFEDVVTFWQSKNDCTLNDYNHPDAVLLCDPDLSQTDYLLKQCEQKNIRFGRRVTTSNLAVAANIAMMGGGCAILPERVAHCVRPGTLVPVDGAPVFHDKICLVYRHENRNVRAIQKIIEEIKAHVVSVGTEAE